MSYMIALLMASLCFLLNRLFLRTVGPVTLISLGPLAEEAAKTLFAYYLGADIVAVHALFGIIEAVYDWFQDRENGHLLAPVLSVSGHLVFGAITAGVLSLTGRIWLGLLAGTVVHLAYNVAVVRLLSGNPGRDPGRRDKP